MLRLKLKIGVLLLDQEEKNELRSHYYPVIGEATLYAVRLAATHGCLTAVLDATTLADWGYQLFYYSSGGSARDIVVGALLGEVASAGAPALAADIALLIKGA